MNGPLKAAVICVLKEVTAADGGQLMEPTIACTKR
jgi:hypothetical protein